MTVRKIFLSAEDEHKFLKQMNGKGFELMSASPFTYNFDKTDREVAYQYIPIKGRRGYNALDYKSKDKDAKAVYAKSDIALFKKSADKGDFTILSANELNLRLIKRRSAAFNRSLALIALCALLATLGARANSTPPVILSAILLVFAIIGIIKNKNRG